MNVDTTYSYIDNIKSGDLLIWYDNYSTWYNNIILYIVRLLTRSEYGHVGIAWVVSGKLFVIEATMPVIRIMPVNLSRSFYHIAMDLEWTKEGENFLLDKVGLDYSIKDAVAAYLGKTVEHDNRWQCAELAIEFYRKYNLDVGDDFTPSGLVKSIMERLNKKLVLVKAAI